MILKFSKNAIEARNEFVSITILAKNSYIILENYL